MYSYHIIMSLALEPKLKEKRIRLKSTFSIKIVINIIYFIITTYKQNPWFLDSKNHDRIKAIDKIRIRIQAIKKRYIFLQIIPEYNVC